MKRLMITLVLLILAVFLLSACTDVKTVESGQKPTLPSLDAPTDEKEESANITEQAVPIVDSHSVDETSAIVDSESTQFNQTPETKQSSQTAETTQSSQTVETMPSERETPEATSDTLNDSSEDMTMPTQPQSTQPTSSESNNNIEDDEDEEVQDDVEVTAGEIHFG